MQICIFICTYMYIYMDIYVYIRYKYVYMYVCVHIHEPTSNFMFVRVKACVYHICMSIPMSCGPSLLSAASICECMYICKCVGL